MSNKKHFKAIACIEKRISELNNQIKISEKRMEEPEMLSDYEFSLNDILNSTQEICELQETITYLIK